MNTTGDRIKMLRQKHGLTQQKLADKIGCTIESIRRYEKNKYLPETINLIKLACALNVTSDYLLCLNSNEESNEENDIEYQEYLKTYNNAKLNILEPDGEYYLIHYHITLKGEIEIESGFGSMWGGFTDDRTREIRVPRCINKEVISKRLVTAEYNDVIVINTEEEANAFRLFGGRALIKQEICIEFLPDLIKPVYLDLGWEVRLVEEIINGGVKAKNKFF